MKPQCTTSADCLRELARVMDQFGINSPLKAINSHYVVLYARKENRNFVELPFFVPPENWQFAIAEVEGKPVFVGDELYDINNGTKHKINYGICHAIDWSWNPPKPATVMVEMLVEDAEWWLSEDFCSDRQVRVKAACKKALETK